jgi:predicted SnoaL-like aldol condensation-catalyzing enzyme
LLGFLLYDSSHPCCGRQVSSTLCFVIVHSRFSGFGQATNGIVADVVRVVVGILVEHWDVVEDKASQADSTSGRPMFGERCPA